MWQTLLLWSILVIIPMVFVHVVLAWKMEGAPLQHLVYNLLIFRILMIILVYYVHSSVLLPRFFFKARYWQYAVGILLLAAVVFLFHKIMMPHPPHPPQFKEGINLLKQERIPPYFIKPPVNIFLFFVALFVSYSRLLTERYEAVRRTQLVTELSLLKAQINPHFLFNALNSIYLLSIKKSEKTSEAIVQLSEMMRYVTTEADSNRVSLEKEIAYLNNYIAIQQLRLAPTVQLQYAVEGDPLGKQIAPMLLISFIENAFKYGISTTEPCEIVIHLRIEPTQQLFLEVKNQIFQRQTNNNNKESSSSGVGIDNTQKRLEYFYPQKHRLALIETATHYQVLLELNLS